jgi:hypothetical protein
MGINPRRFGVPMAGLLVPSGWLTEKRFEVELKTHLPHH